MSSNLPVQGDSRIKGEKSSIGGVGVVILHLEGLVNLWELYQSNFLKADR